MAANLPADSRLPRRLTALWSSQVRIVLGTGHVLGLVLAIAVAFLWPVAAPQEQRFARWLLGRLEWLAPALLLIVARGLITVRGRVDERCAALPTGLGRAFLQRWLLSLAYVLLCVSAFCCLLCAKAGIPVWWRPVLSSLVTAAFFSAIASRVHCLTGSEGTGWAAGAGSLLAAIALAGRWCPDDVARQMWLPFLGQSPAGAGLLLLNKLGYALAAGELLAGSLRDLAVPERLLSRSD